MSPCEVDDDLIRAAKAGDADAWRRLYENVAPRLVGWLRAQRKSDFALDAEDLASEAWLTAARRIGEFTGDADDFAGWLFVVARNVMANAYRRGARRATLPTEIDPRLFARDPGHDDGGGPDAQSIVEAADWIRSVLAALPPRERDVVAAIDIADLDVAATSRLLRITRTAVRSAHHRGLRRLAAVLADDSSGGRPPAAAAELRWPVTVARVAADGSVSS